MRIVDNILDSINKAFGFNEPIVYKYNSDLEEQYQALVKLNEEYPNNKKIVEKLKNVYYGNEGEKQVLYQLKKSNIGMYILRDVKLIHEDLTAQIDFVILTPLYTYYIECKNELGNVIVNEKGDFIKEYKHDGQIIRRGMPSPLTQVEKQRDVIKRIWDGRTSNITKFFASKHFNHYRRALVVFANKFSIVDTSNAPDDIKHKVLRTDSLVRQMDYDYNHRDKNEVLLTKKQLDEAAESYMKLCDKYQEDWYSYYKDIYCGDNTEEVSDLKEKLRKFRSKRAAEMKYPPYYVFNNEELDKLVETKPKSIGELDGILSPVKIRVHGGEIIKIINGV